MSNLFESKLSNKDLSPEALKDWVKGREKFLTTDITERVSSVSQNCKHIVPLIDAVKGEDGAVILRYQNYPNAVTLYQWVKENRDLLSSNLNPGFLRSLLEALFKGLEELHSVGVVHRDVNPTNYLITDINDFINSIRLGDFELAQISGETNMDFGLPIGTPIYAPEDQRYMNWKVYESMDQFALGLVIIFILTGGLIDPSELTQSVAMTEGYWTILEKYGPKLANALNKAIQKDYQKRYSTVKEFKAELFKALEA